MHSLQKLHDKLRDLRDRLAKQRAGQRSAITRYEREAIGANQRVEEWAAGPCGLGDPDSPPSPLDARDCCRLADRARREAERLNVEVEALNTTLALLRFEVLVS